MMDSDESDPDAGVYQSSDDEDYVPDGASGDDDDDDYVIQKGKTKTKGKTKGKKQQKKTKKTAQKPTRRSSRNRSRGFSLREPDSDEESDELLASSDSEEEDDQEDIDENESDGNQEEEKKRIDNIWNAMKDEGTVKKVSTAAGEKGGSDDDQDETEKKNSVNDVGSDNEVKEEDDATDTKLNVSEHKPNDSKEILDAVNEENNKEDVKTEGQTTATGVGKKRSGGLGDLVGSLNKKQKISTLDKSKLDWESFKKDKGLEDELRNKSKDGYLSKQEFLQRVDYRTWENERELRLATGRGKK